MKKKFAACILFLCILLSLSSCAGSASVLIPEATEIYLIPNSYLTFTRTDAEEGAQTLNQMGAEYCTKAAATEDGVEAELTETQRDHLIERNDRMISEFFKDFTAANSDYTYEEDPEYRKLSFYFDEEIPIVLEMNAVFGSATGYGLNQILQYHQTDWSVEITIYNCHTKKTVVSMNIPEDEATYGPEEWSKSYE